VDLGPFRFVGPCYLLPIAREFKDVYSLLLRRVRRVPRCQADGAPADDEQQEVFERVGLSKIGIHARQVIMMLPDGMDRPRYGSLGWVLGFGNLSKLPKAPSDPNFDLYFSRDLLPLNSIS
jgi:hypothetical protein